jgi:hypothetical protein
MKPGEARFSCRSLIPLLLAGLVVGISVLILSVALLRAGAQAETHLHESQPTTDPNWLELIASMDKMHMAMGAVERSGNADVDFVRLMIPHHQAAIEMAKTQLLYGKDRRCADSRRKSSPTSNQKLS